MKKLFTFSFAIGLALISIFSYAQPQPTLPRINLEVYVSGFDSITDIVSAGDSRLFVVEQQGRVWIVDASGNLLPSPFLDINHLLMLDHNERGLLGLAFDPDYATNGYFYVNYTSLPDGQTHISRFQVSADPNMADPTTEVVILTQSQPFRNHNAGDLNFGADGYLYIPLGDGGSGGDPLDNGQDGSTLLGKMLRIDVSKLPYTIPSDNPFVGDPDVLDEIWSIGLRNPYRFSFDRLTYDMWIGDVGQNAWEEINFEPAGSTGGTNWGWNCYEGFVPFDLTGCEPISHYTFPVFSYDIFDEHCAVQGGFVYRGSDYPGLYGHYVFADFCSGRFWTLYPDGMGGFNHTTQLEFAPFDITTFGEDASGELYAGGRHGNVYRITDIACKNNNIQICHKAGKNDKTLCIGFDEDGIQSHLDHGDELGPCDNSSKTSDTGLQLSVSPNPTSEDVTIEVNSLENQLIKIELFDIRGSKLQEVYNGEVFENYPQQYRIKKSGLNPGIYLIRVTGSSNVENYKLMVN